MFVAGFAGADLTGTAVLTVGAFAFGKVTAVEAFDAGVFFGGMEALVDVEVLAIAEALEGDAVLAGVLALTDVATLDEAVVLAELNFLAVTTGVDLAGAVFLTAATLLATDFDAWVAFVAMKLLH